MRSELETYELIDRYLKEELRGEELLSFEKRLNEDASFAEEVEHQKLVNQVVIGAELDILREKIKGDIADFDKGKGSSLKRWLSGFFGLMILGSAGYFFLTPEIEIEQTPLVEKKYTLNKPRLINENPLNKKQIPTVDLQKKKVETRNTKRALEIPQTEIKTPAEISLKPNQEIIIPDKPIDTKENNINRNPFYHPPVEKKIQPNCKEVKISANALIQGTCQGEQEGIITIYPDDIKGGTGPYLLSINEKETLKSQEVFSGLAAGPYSITIKDKAGCISMQHLVIPEKDCPKMNRFVINPDLGELWKLPVANSESGTIHIFNRSGMLVHTSPFGNQNSNEWDGSGMNGALVGTGVYIYVIEYSNGKKENGQITINR